MKILSRIGTIGDKFYNYLHNTDLKEKIVNIVNKRQRIDPLKIQCILQRTYKTYSLARIFSALRCLVEEEYIAFFDDYGDKYSNGSPKRKYYTVGEYRPYDPSYRKRITIQ